MYAQSCPTLCDPMDCSLPGSSVHRISQAKILEWVAISFSRDLPNPGIELTSHVSFISSVFSTTSATWEAPTSSINNILGAASYTKQAPVSKTTCV